MALTLLIRASQCCWRLLMFNDFCRRQTHSSSVFKRLALYLLLLLHFPVKVNVQRFFQYTVAGHASLLQIIEDSSATSGESVLSLSLSLTHQQVCTRDIASNCDNWRSGIVHRDLKLENFLCSKGRGETC